MSQLLFDWLNDDVRLSRKIVAFGEDFKDGFMFGELLSKFNQQLDFNQFSAKGSPAARLNNFCLLEPSMRKIGVHFNSRIVTDIMAGKETIIKNLLYEMKTALEGIYRINRQNNNQMLHGTASDKALQVIKPTRTSYEKTVSATFSKAIHSTIENTNQVMMDKVLLQHTSKATEYLQSMSMADSDMYDAFMDKRLREKEIDHNKKVKADEFAKSWEAQHIAQWKVNQRTAHDRRMLKEKVQQDTFARRTASRTRFLAETRQDTLQGVDEFNDRLEASLLVAGADLKDDRDSLIKTTTNVPGDNTLSLMYIDRETQRRGLESTQKKMKEHHEDIAVRTLAHDQRRRKFLREYDTMQMKMSQKIFNTEVIAQLLNFAGSEKVEEALMEKVVSYKKIIPDNRRNRQELMDRMAEEDAARGKEWDAVEAKREVHWTIGGARDSHKHRSDVLKTAVASAQRQISTTIALQSIDKLLDVVDWVVSCRQVGVFYYQITEDPAVLTAAIPEAATAAGGKKGKEKEKPAAAASTEGTEQADAPKPRSCKEGEVVPTDIWGDAVKMFMADEPLSAALQVPAPLVVTDTLWPFSISERPACAEVDWLFSKPFRTSGLLFTSEGGDVASEDGSIVTSGSAVRSLAPSLASADVASFIDALNNAEIEGGRGEEGKEPTAAPAPTEKNTLYTPTWITSVQPRHFLGETLLAVRCAVDPIPDEPTAVIDTKHIPLRAALCGVSELARKNLADSIAHHIPGITIIVAADLVTRAFEVHQGVLKAASDAAGAALELEVAGEAAPTADFELPTLLEGSEVTDPTGPVSMVEEGSLAAGESAVDPATGEVEPADAAEADVQRPLTPDPFLPLASAVYDALLAGQTVSDELYVALIVHTIKQINVKNTGYVVQDFPNTKRQALLLMEAFSGMNFDSHRPQPTDKASPYAPPSPAEVWTYDVSKCGLDTIIHVDNGTGISTAFDQRARARKVLETGEVMYISDDQTSIKGLEVIDDLTRPFHATGIDLTIADTANSELTEFCAKIRLLDTFRISDFATPEEAVATKAQELCDRYIPPEYFLAGYLPGTELMVDELVEIPLEENAEPYIEEGPVPEQAEAQDGAEITEGGEAEPSDSAVAADEAVPVEGAPADAGAAGEEPAPPAEEPVVEEVKEKYVYQMPPAIFKPNAIPVPLADALLRMWNTSETQSERKSKAYFDGVRDIRYQMLQRRRAAFDSVSSLLVKLDNRQEIFDSFRQKFNNVSSDMRFDPDCVAELHLQTLELCDALIKLCEARKQAAEVYTKKVSADAVVTMLQHRCSCESVAMAQSELQRFFVVLHLLFDYAKSVRGYEMHIKVLNELEVTLPVTLPAESEGGKKDAKKEAKKGKEVAGAAVPFREPIAAVLVPKVSMEAVPEVNGGDEAADPKAKKAPAKEKKGGATESGDPFTDIATKILEEAEKWRKSTFQVAREVYEKDEALCSALEQAIWYEAEKLVLSIGNIKASLANDVAWLGAAEQEMGAIMADMVSKRYIKELTAVNQLVARIEHAIESADPLPALWLVSPDSIAVDPAQVWSDFQDHLPVDFKPSLQLQSIPEADVEQSQPATPSGLGNFKPTLSPGNKKLLNKAKQMKNPRSGFVPEHTEDAGDLDSSRKKNIEKQSLSNRTTHLRHASAPVTAESAADEQFRKEMAIYEAKRLTFEHKLLTLRAEREKEFRALGMSAVTAKLAAYNEMLMDEQQDMLDFEARFRPKKRPISHAARRASNAGNMARRPSSAVKSNEHLRRPTSANAAMH